MGKYVRLFVVCLFMGQVAFSSVDYSHGIADKSKVVGVAASVTSEKYPDADTVIIDQSEVTSYATNGTSIKWAEMYLKILTEKGRRANTTVASYFTIPYQRGTNDCNIPLVEMIKPDGRIVSIDVAAQSKVMINPGSMSANIYNPNDKLIRVNIAGLEVGDVLHFIMFDRTVQARMENTWSDWLTFEGTRPIIHRAVEVSAPKDMPLRNIALKAEIKGTVKSSKEEQNERIVYRWDVQNVPRMFFESRMPSMSTVVQRLLISTIPDWETVSKWYWKISEPHYEASPEMRIKVKELTVDAKTQKEKIDKLFKFVSQEVRYMGITVEDTAPGYEPHDVKDTFKDRSGVCRDKAALLVVMLRLAEIKAFPTLIMVGPRKDEEVPQPYFNHAIVAALGEDGSYILMDPTSEVTSKLLPAYLNYKSYLVARPEGEKLLTSPIDPAENNMLNIKTVGSVTVDGDLKCKTELEFYGINDNAYRGYFARAKQEDRVRLIEGMIRSNIPGAHISSIKIEPEEIMNTTIPLRITVSYEASDILISGDDKKMLPLPIFGNSIGIAGNVIGSAGLEKRKYPLKTDIACGVSEQIKLGFAPELGEVVSLPVNKPIENKSFDWKINISEEDNEIVFNGIFKLKTVEFSPSEYLILKDALKRIQVALRKKIILAKDNRATDADVLILKDNVTYELLDNKHWKKTIEVTKKVLTYSGKKKSGEIKIAYNPELETVLVTNAVVIGKDGVEHPLKKKEINEMDASWVGAAPRYPAGKILVVSLPAVEVGAIIRYRIIKERKQGPFFSVSESFSGMNPIEKVMVKVVLPKDLKVKVNQDGFSGAFTTGTDSMQRVVMSWSKDNISAVKREDMLPPWWTFNETVFISTGSWDEYAREINKLLVKAAKKERPVVELTKKMLRKEKDSWKRVELIRNYVATHVRSVGPGLAGLPLNAISPATTTLNDGYGNTTDKAILLYSMLKSAGYNPEFILVSSIPNIKSMIDNVQENPDARKFNTVLVRLSDEVFGLPAGKYIYLNDTDQYAILGAAAHEEGLGLTLSSGKLEKINPVKKSKTETNYAISISPTGEAVITRRMLLYGLYYGVKNRQYIEMTPEKMERYFQGLISGVSQGATRVGKLMHDFSVYPGEVVFSVRVPDYAIVTKKELYFSLPESMSGLYSLRSDKRINPMYQPGDQNEKLSIKVELPKGYRVGIKPLSWSCSDVGGLDLDIKVADNYKKNGELELIYNASAVMSPSIISPSHYKALLDVDKRLSHKRARNVLLMKE